MKENLGNIKSLGTMLLLPYFISQSQNSNTNFLHIENLKGLHVSCLLAYLVKGHVIFVHC